MELVHNQLMLPQDATSAVERPVLERSRRSGSRLNPSSETRAAVLSICRLRTSVRTTLPLWRKK